MLLNLQLRHSPRSTLFPYTTLFRSIANGENSADGSGITPSIYRALLKSGVDCITLGDHIYRRQEIESVLRTETNIVDRKSTRLNSSHVEISYAVFCLKKKKSKHTYD